MKPSKMTVMTIHIVPKLIGHQNVNLNILFKNKSTNWITNNCNNLNYKSPTLEIFSLPSGPQDHSKAFLIKIWDPGGPNLRNIWIF